MSEMMRLTERPRTLLQLAQQSCQARGARGVWRAWGARRALCARRAWGIAPLAAVLLGLPALLALFAGDNAAADIVHAIGTDPADGEVTMLADTGELVLTAKDGSTSKMRLDDVSLVEFGKQLVIVGGGDLLVANNDKGPGSQTRTASVKLRAGLHRFVIAYWQATDEHALSVKVAGPGTNGQAEMTGSLIRCFRDSDEVYEPSPGIDGAGYRLPELPLKEADNPRRLRDRANYRLYVGSDQLDFKNVGVINALELKRTGTTNMITTGVITDPTTHLGLVFDGFFVAKADGEYSFTLASNDGSQLYLGEADNFFVGGEHNAHSHTPWVAELAHEGRALGELKQIKDGQAVFHIPLAGDVSIGLDHVRALWDSRAAEAIDRSDPPAGLDTAYIRDKNDADEIVTVSGKAIALDDASLTFAFRGKQRTIDRARLAGLVFKHADRPAPPSPGVYQELRLGGGQVLPTHVKSIDKQISFQLIGGNSATPPRDAIVSIRTVNGRIIDLTRTAPAFEETIPYFGFKIPSRINSSFTGEPIQLFNQITYPRGIAVHSKSRLHYKLDRPAQRFKATFGLIDPGGQLGNVTARVLGDGKVLWEQQDITAESKDIDVDVELKGATRLVLEVDFGKGQNVGDRAAWCNPQIIFPAQDAND